MTILTEGVGVFPVSTAKQFSRAAVVRSRKHNVRSADEGVVVRVGVVFPYRVPHALIHEVDPAQFDIQEFNADGVVVTTEGFGVTVGNGLDPRHAKHAYPVGSLQTDAQGSLYGFGAAN